MESDREGQVAQFAEMTQRFNEYAEMAQSFDEGRESVGSICFLILSFVD